MRKRRREKDFDIEQPWQMGWWRRSFRTVRKRESFHTLVALARMVNMLRFVQAVEHSLVKSDTSAYRRQVLNAFFLSSALLVEGMDLVQRIGKHFRHRPEFQNGLGRLLRDPDFKRVVTTKYRRLRKKSAFHFDDDVIEGGLTENDDKFVPFISSSGGKKRGSHYYELADITAMQVLVGPCESAKEFTERVCEALDEATPLANRFIKAADDFNRDRGIGVRCPNEADERR